MSTQDSLAERYGAPSRMRRRLLVAATAALVAVFLGWLVWAVVGHTRTQVTSELEGFSVIDDSTVSAVLVVNLTGDAEAWAAYVHLAEELARERSSADR